ncbi:MAG: penicillin-binding protein 2 [Chloroflexi bacterium]|nr:penicillin-binding protein 2 [Chloroflexota bacterium]
MTAAGRSRPGRSIGRTLTGLGAALSLAFGAIAAGAGYWQVLRSQDLASSPDDIAVVAASRQVVRGLILDRDGKTLASSERDGNGEPYRVYASRSLSGVIGYASRLYGAAGLERAYDAQISGVVSADPLRDLLRKFQGLPSDPQTVRSTLSFTLQNQAVELLGADTGAIVMLNPKTGAVLALASTPTYDAGAIANPATSRSAFETLQNDPARPLLPRATQGRFVPGSVFKIVTAVAALESGAISPQTSFEQQPAAERDGLTVSGFTIHDGHHTATGSRELVFDEAVEVSCNIYFALAGLETGGDALATEAEDLGFGAPLPFALPTSPSQVTGGRGDFGGGFRDAVELASASFGQGETFVTPLQMALVAAAVANDGVIMRPRLVDAFVGQDGTTTVGSEEWRRVMSSQVAAEVTAAMVRAVEGELGRRYTSGAQVAGVHVAGKSGTAELGGGSEPHSWFIGFAPADDPTLVIAVVVERGGRGGARAAPIAGELLRSALGR